MTFEETRDNTTDIEAAIIAADAHETDPRPFRQPEERHEEHNDGANGYDPEDPEHDEIGDAETEYDIEFDAEGVGSVDLAAIRRGMIWMGVFPNQAL